MSRLQFPLTEPAMTAEYLRKALLGIQERIAQTTRWRQIDMETEGMRARL